MNRTLKVLIVEDNEDNALLLVKLIESGGYQTVYERVETNEAYREALSRQNWDIILSDYALPTFSGLIALRLLREQGLDTPFIIVSGKIDEDTAVTAMRAGAHDYILKDNIKRLLPAIERELKEANARASHKMSQKVLKQTEARYKRIVDSNMIGLFFWDIQGNITDANQAFLDLAGISRDDVLAGKLRWKDFVDPESDPVVRQALLELYQTGICAPVEKRYSRPDGTFIDVLVGAAFFDESREAGVAFVLDLSERRAREEAEKANLRKNMFLVNLSHELRTPLHTIITASSMALEGMLGALNDKQTEYFTLIHESGNHLLVLINEILDIAKIEAGKDILVVKPLQIRDIMDEALDLVRPLLEQKSQHISVNIDENVPQTINGDPVRLKQVLCNLLSNAHYFSPEESHVELSCRLKSDQELVISVKDEGPGLSEEDTNYVLQPFEQVIRTEIDKSRGTGLGLPLSKKLVELHHGRLEIKSIPGQGSTFSIYLPTAPVSSAVS